MGDLRRHIHGPVQFLKGIQILGKRLPIPSHAFSECAARNILDALHQTDQPLLSVRRSGRKADPAITHDNRGHTVPRRGRHLLIPRCLTIIVSVNVDKTRDHNTTRRIDFLCGSLR